MSSPADCRFLESHEWHKQDGAEIILGLSKFAVDELTDITFVQLPAPGAAFKAGDSIGEIESVKATSEIYTGVGGTITAVNAAAVNDPSIINNEPFAGGWLVKIKPTDPAEIGKLLDAAAYDKKYAGH